MTPTTKFTFERLDERRAERAAKRIPRIVAEATISDLEIAELQVLLRKYLTSRVLGPDLASMDGESFDSLPPHLKGRVYWEELDNIAGWVRRQVHDRIAERILAATDFLHEPVQCALNLRQLAEITVWAVYYQYLQTTALNLLRRNLQTVDSSALYVCPVLERAVRAAVAPSWRRIKSGQAAIGAAEPSEPPDHWIAELTASGAKQTAILRYIAENLPEIEADAADLKGLVTRLEHAYDFLCGLSHCTPLMLLTTHESEDGHQIRALIGPLLPATTHACLRILDRLYFYDRFAAVRFAERFAATDAAISSTVSIEIPDFDRFLDGDKKVVLATSSGSAEIYDGQRNKSRL